MKTIDTLSAERDAAAARLSDVARRCDPEGAPGERMTLLEAERDFWQAEALLHAATVKAIRINVRGWLKQARAVAEGGKSPHPVPPRQGEGTQEVGGEGA